jgi:hypothetical protein
MLLTNIYKLFLVKDANSNSKRISILMYFFNRSACLDSHSFHYIARIGHNSDVSSCVVVT